MSGSIDILYFLQEIGTVKEQLDENWNNKLGEIRNSVSDEFEKNYKQSETVLNYIDMLLEVNERDNSFNKRRESNTRLKFILVIFAIWKILIEEDFL